MMRLFVFTLMCAFLPCSAFAGVTYSYDEQSRLTQARYTDGGTVTFSYDATGNRLGATVTGRVSGATAEVGGSAVGSVGESASAPSASGGSAREQHRLD